MSPTLIVCPRCSTQLQSPGRGRLVQCGRCGATLLLNLGEQEKPIPRAETDFRSSPTATNNVPAPLDRDEKPSVPLPSHQAYLVGLILAGVVLVLSSALVVVLALFWQTDKADTTSLTETPSAPHSS